MCVCVLLVGVVGVLGVAGLSVSVTHTASSDTDVFDTVVILQNDNNTQHEYLSTVPVCIVNMELEPGDV